MRTESGRRLAASDTPSDRLREISTWISSVLDLDELLELIIEKVTRIMQAKASSLLLLDRKTEKLYFKVATGEKKEEVRKYEVGLGQGIAGYVAKTGEPLLIADVHEDPRWDRTISEYTGFQTTSIACVPMKANGEVIGVVEIIDKEDGTPIRYDDMQTLEAFSELAALAINNARNIDRVKRENEDLREELGGRYRIIGESPTLQRVITDAVKVANSKTSTLILGESGTGKELIARLIHRAGPRKSKSLVALNCAALPETLLEAELFGYERGAFTGALSKKIGKFELADGGTLFLDEIGEMALGMQVKLLRVLEGGQFYRVGGTAPISVDVRIIAATNKDLAHEVAESNFREDLYYRLNVVQIRMPALREIKEDIPHLTTYFTDMFAHDMGLQHIEISQEAMEKMISHDWPGNVRELRNAVERAVVMGNGREILPEDLPIPGLKVKYPNLSVGLSFKEALENFKKEFIVLNLKHAGGNRSRAAKAMSIQRTYLSRLISRYGLTEI